MGLWAIHVSVPDLPGFEEMRVDVRREPPERRAGAKLMMGVRRLRYDMIRTNGTEGGKKGVVVRGCPE